MRLAVFTSKFPHRVSTFFARDIRGLLEAGVEVDVFPIYPVDATQWRYVPDILNERVLPRDRVHHITLRESFRLAGAGAPAGTARWLGDALRVGASAARYGPGPLAKSAYVVVAGRAWARRFPDSYDHILAYWGNYAATGAYVFQRLTNPAVPFSIMLHAGTDLYRTPVYLRQKLLYADNVIVPCEFNRRYIRERHADVAEVIDRKVHVHHLGLDCAEYAYAPGGRAPRTVLAAGGFDKVKGFDYLLRAAAELRRRGVAVNVELVGDGSQGEALRALARSLGIADHVTFLGWLVPSDVRAAMLRAAVLVHPSTGLGDAVPTVIKEAMAVGTPVIASDVAGIPELLDQGRCGVLVPPRDVGALAGAVERLLADESRRRQLAAAGREYAERTFDLWRNGRRLADLLRSTTRAAVAARAA